MASTKGEKGAFSAVFNQINSHLDVAPKMIIGWLSTVKDATSVSKWKTGMCPRDAITAVELHLGFEKIWEERKGLDAPMPSLTEAYVRENPGKHETIVNLLNGARASERNGSVPIDSPVPDRHLTVLIAQLASAKEELAKGSLFDRILAGQLGETRESILSYPARYMAVPTHVLYATLARELYECDDVRIVDQDILRWYELVASEDKIPCNTFNYSTRILDTSIAAATDRDSYNVKRIFVVPMERLESPHREHVAEILETIEALTDGYEAQLQTRVYIPGQARAAAQLDRQLEFVVRDAVLLSAEGDTLLLQEDINWRAREDPNTSRSRISHEPEVIRECEAIFMRAFTASQPIRTFLESLN